jgi:PAS domain S-box-containing protein
VNHLFLRRSELVSLVVALAMLVAIAAFSILDWTGYRQDRSEVLSSRHVLDDADSLLLALTQAEVTERGFILTGNKELLDPYTGFVETVRQKLDALDKETVGNGPLRGSWLSGRIGELRTQVNGELAALNEGIDLRQRNELTGGVELLNSNRGVALATSIRKLAADIHSQLSRWVEERSVIVRADSDRSHLVTVASSVVLLILLVMGALNINLAAEKREELIERLAGEQRQASEVRDLLKTTLFSIGDAVLVTDRQGRVSYLNRVAESLTGWKEAQASGHTVREVFQIADEMTGELAENPVERILRGGPRAHSGNAILRTRDGREIPIDDSVAPIEAPGGEVLGVVLVFRDITNRRAAEREKERLLHEAQMARRDAERQRSHLHSLFLQAPASINIYRGPNHVFELLHPLAKRYIGGLDVTGKPAREVILDPWFADFLDAVYRQGEPRARFEVTRIVADEEGNQSERWFNYFCCPWRDVEGVIAGVMTLAVDVTESVRLKQQMRETEERLRESAKLESLGVLAGGIAHDFNNLLVGIMGNASLALDDMPDGHPARFLIRDVISAADRAAVLTRQMLAYSGRGQFIIEPVNLSELVADMLPLLTGSVPRQVTLRTELAAGLPAVEADSAQLQQIFMNLVINGAEACGTVPGTVTIRTGMETIAGPPRQSFGLPHPQPGAYVTLEVNDTGAGMDAETRARIFDPFFSTKFTGRGLGLSAVLGIIRSHKGAIDVISEPGKGSTFRVFFPASAAVAHTLPPELSSSSFTPGSGTVLVIDDEDLVRKMARAALECHGYRVLEAQHGGDAVAQFRERHREIDLVVLDLTMPVMSGEETLLELRRLRSDISVLLSSGFSETEATRRFEKAKLAGFLQKPYTSTQLARAVRNAMESANAA